MFIDQQHIAAGSTLGEQIFGKPSRVMLDDIERVGDNRVTAAKVLGQPDNVRVRVTVTKGKQIANGGPPKAIDRLVIVADHGQAGAVPGQ
jgi:hypothetical protein